MKAVAKLQDAMGRLPQIEMVTRHHFCDGLYLRELEQPAMSVVVGKIHKREHYLIVLRGRIAIRQGEDTRTLEAGAIVKSEAGTKRAILAVEDSVYMTVHPNPENMESLGKIEDELIIPEAASLFDARNKLKELT